MQSNEDNQVVDLMLKHLLLRQADKLGVTGNGDFIEAEAEHSGTQGRAGQ